MNRRDVLVAAVRDHEAHELANLVAGLDPQTWAGVKHDDLHEIVRGWLWLRWLIRNGKLMGDC